MLDLLFQVLLPVIEALAKGKPVDREVGGGIGVNLLQALIRSTASQDSAVARLEEKVDRLVLQSYRTGLDQGQRYLDEARATGSVAPERLSAARSHFVSASSHAADAGLFAEAADVEVSIAACSALLGDVTAVGMGLGRAADLLERAMQAKPVRTDHLNQVVTDRARQEDASPGDFLSGILARGHVSAADVKSATSEVASALASWRDFLAAYSRVQTLIGRQRGLPGDVQWDLPAASPPDQRGGRLLNALSSAADPFLPLSPVTLGGRSRGFGVEVEHRRAALPAAVSPQTVDLWLSITTERECSVHIAAEPMTLFGGAAALVAPSDGFLPRRRSAVSFDLEPGSQQGSLSIRSVTPTTTSVLMTVSSKSTRGINACQYRLDLDAVRQT